MKLVNIREAQRFSRGDKAATNALQAWITVVRASTWKNFSQIRTTCGRSADKVGTLTVFNVGGNKYRVIARVDFEFQLVHIVAVLDHQQYDRGRWKNM